MDTTTANTTVNADEILGGTENGVATTETTTPGKAARIGGEKRKYTPRGTTIPTKRVVLVDGKPIGRGAPKHAELSRRRVVFIPKDAAYDAAIFGEGVKFNMQSKAHNQSVGRANVNDVPWIWDDATKTATLKPKSAIVAEVKPASKPKAGKKSKAKAPAKAKKVALTIVASSPENVPVAEAPVAELATA